MRKRRTLCRLSTSSIPDAIRDGELLFCSSAANLAIALNSDAALVIDNEWLVPDQLELSSRVKTYGLSSGCSSWAWTARHAAAKTRADYLWTCVPRRSSNLHPLWLAAVLTNRNGPSHVMFNISDFQTQGTFTFEVVYFDSYGSSLLPLDMYQFLVLYRYRSSNVRLPHSSTAHGVAVQLGGAGLHSAPRAVLSKSAAQQISRRQDGEPATAAALIERSSASFHMDTSYLGEVP
eukprot:6180669-Pleurochrysis_carterae.AAC.3